MLSQSTHQGCYPLPSPHLLLSFHILLIISSGMLRYADGRVYEGLWREDQKHGMGEQRWTHGHVYSGMWNRDMREGMGTMSYPDGSTYKGNLGVTCGYIVGREYIMYVLRSNLTLTALY